MKVQFSVNFPNPQPFNRNPEQLRKLVPLLRDKLQRADKLDDAKNILFVFRIFLLHKYDPFIDMERNVHLSFLAKPLEGFLQTFAALRLVALFTSFRVFPPAVCHFVHAQFTTRGSSHGKTTKLKLSKCVVLQPN